MSDTTYPNGRKTEVIIQTMPRSVNLDPFGGSVNLEYDRLAVWADVGLKPVFEKIEGIVLVTLADFSNRYILVVDPRYDTDYIRAEVEAAAMGVISEARTNISWKYGPALPPPWNPDLFRLGES